MRIYSASLSLYLCKQYLRAPFCPRLVAERKLHPDTDKQKKYVVQGAEHSEPKPSLDFICPKLGEFNLTRVGYCGKGMIISAGT